MMRVALSQPKQSGPHDVGLIWQSYVHRDIAHSKQGEMLAHADDIRGHTVYAASWDLADAFVLLAVGGREGTVPDVDGFLSTSDDGDFWLTESFQRRANARASRTSYVLLKRNRTDIVCAACASPARSD